MNFKTRPGILADKEWLYDLYCSNMRIFIEQTWGWDEAFQRNGFQTNLRPVKFHIVLVHEDRAGAYLVKKEKNHNWLEMLLVSKKMQGKGLGTAIIKKLQAQAEKEDMPLKLSVLKVNPAKDFYTRLGFHLYDQDEWFFKMKWPLEKPPRKTRR